MKYTIGYIDHNKEVFNRLLGPSIKSLKGEFSVISVESDKFPAENYNRLVSMAKTPYIILTHQDVTFSSDLLERIDLTIDALDGEFGALGMVGVDKLGNYHWSELDRIYELDTADCCFLVIRTDNDIKFDTEKFGDYHLYVEDYCAQLNRIKKKSIYTISTISRESDPNFFLTESEGTFLNHHSCTVSTRGFCWGRYPEFRKKLNEKWPNIKTT
jgi:hypothetical protein